MNAAIKGYAAAIQAFNQDHLVPDAYFDWNTYQARRFRYWLNLRYYDDTMYTQLAQFAETLKEDQKLYKHIRSLRNPVTRLVKLEAARVFGGALNYYDLTEGAMPLLFTKDMSDRDRERLTKSIQHVWMWSAMDKLKNTVPIQGGKFGDSFINVVDDRDRRKVYMQWLDPRKLYDMEVDHMGNVKQADIRYEKTRVDPNTEKVLEKYEYRLLVDGDSYQYFKDNEPFDYVNNIKDGPRAAYQNEYGFVPLRHIPHVDSGLKYGETSYAESINKINNLNDLVSLLHDNVRKAVDTKYWIASDSVVEEGTLNASTDDRDESAFLQGGPGDTITPIVNPIDIMGVLQAANALQEEIDDDMPQLALQKIRRQNTELSGKAIQNLYGDAIDLTQNVQGNYISGFIAATQMGISIAAHNRYEDFTDYSLDSYSAGALNFAIRPKQIFHDELTTKEKLDLVAQTLKDSAWKIVLQETGLGDHIEDVQRMLNENKAQATASAARGIMQALGMGNDTEDDSAEETAQENAVA